MSHLAVCFRRSDRRFVLRDFAERSLATARLVPDVHPRGAQVQLAAEVQGVVGLGLAGQGPSTQGHVVEAVLFTVQNVPVERGSAELLQQRTIASSTAVWVTTTLFCDMSKEGNSSMSSQLLTS